MVANQPAPRSPATFFAYSQTKGFPSHPVENIDDYRSG